MNYEFPYIDNISDIKLEEGTSILTVEKDGYIVMNYINLNPNNFPEVTEPEHAFARECRGITFDAKTGKCISRPFHKFFNVGERPETDFLDYVGSTYQAKRDGSIIHPIYLEKGTRLATRAGITDISMRAETLIAADYNYQELLKFCRDAWITVIFEYTAPTNKIVLNYEEKSLTILAFREINTGKYIDIPNLDRYGSSIKIEKHMNVSDIINSDNVRNMVSDEVDMEGYVITFPTGHKVKVKCDWYVKLHKYVDAFKSDRHLAKTILDKSFDDLYSYASPEIRKRLDLGRERLNISVVDLAGYLTYIADGIKRRFGDDKKEIAFHVIENYAKTIQPLLFKTIQSETPMKTAENIVYDFIRRNSTKETLWETNVLNIVNMPKGWLID